MEARTLTAKNVGVIKELRSALARGSGSGSGTGSGSGSGSASGSSVTPPPVVSPSPTAAPTVQPVISTPGCTDTSPDKVWCGFWKSKGYCTAGYKNYMESYCAQTCGTCDKMKTRMTNMETADMPSSPADALLDPLTDAAGMLSITKTILLFALMTFMS